ncbi:hypothetical protein MOO44_07440 [Nicoliella spurrieriana]|uniref:Replicative helicase loading/DNA remodeling protein DnaB N-terminal winged helix domain-containing protein n=1 Tax=Nicoliella spurrieriana TaxID=2925830 RepID=A0A976RS22_9LACO|nr:hypothetical protein [Nicoliella spurrieriana]UQS86710.1 hypothetical protein MOO44_07440 [Nicoliella spurrieriana]
MSNQLAQNDPQTGFIVVKNERLSDLASEAIDLLYQPVIGSVATALIRLLWRYSDERREEYQQRSHSDVFAFLQIDFRRFKECRIKLEGAGLLRTFVQQTDSSPVIIYQLVPPLTDRQFFNDDLLSLALLENIGESMYQRLANRLLIKPFQAGSAEEITQNFLDSFQIDADQITDQPQTIGNLKRDYALQTPVNDAHAKDDFQVDAKDFDFNLVLDCLAKSYVHIDQVKKYYQLIVNEHRMYGIDEVSIAKLIVRATNVRNNVFDPTKLKILVSRMYEAPVQTPAPDSNQTPAADAQPKSGEFNAQERSLIKGAEYYPPATFLAKLKHAHNGFPTGSENHLIEEMLDRHVMTDGALNMLIYHVLIDRDNPQIPKQLFNYVANDWIQNYHVRSAVDAMRAIKEYNQKQSAGDAKPKRSYYRNQQPVNHFEPDWMKKDYQPKDEEITDEEQRKMEQLLKDFNNNK